MPVTAESLRAVLPSVDPRLIEEHLSRLDARYFERFALPAIASHVEDLAGLAPASPVCVRFREVPGGEAVEAARPARTHFECTVLAEDHPGVFSLVTGVLSSAGYDILSGDAFTWAPAPAAPSVAPGARAPRLPWAGRRCIVDCFTGTLAEADMREGWEEQLRGQLRAVFGLLDSGPDGELAARRMVNELAASRLATLPGQPPGQPLPVAIELEEIGRACTRMRVVSQDTPFFLFTFSSALSLQKVSLEQVMIRTHGTRIEDSFEFVDADGRPVPAGPRMDRIRLSVLLTKQFTSFLGRAPDPLAALLRYESLVSDLLAHSEQGRWLELLSDGRVLADLAQLLGASTFLWEDFVRLQYEQLLPLLAPEAGGAGFCGPLETLRPRLEAALAGARDREGFEKGLNTFKDREIYLADLDHILGRGSDLLTLARRLTALAEEVLRAAAGFAWDELVNRFGEPRTAAGLPVRYALLGLGKFGGAALGYASDIEVLLIYGDSGRTAGSTGIENSEFFDRLVRELPRLVRAKREGIFHIDLRLRPFGAAGPLACSLGSFCTYYAADGPAHAYERLALVRLRAVGGDPALGAQVERLRDEMLYTGAGIDLPQLAVVRRRQLQEKTRAGAVNAKFSPGALVDVEYAVQVLQVLHGASEKRLRTPRIHEALESLSSLGILDPAQAGELVAAYRFFRRLINGLRMLRGSAQDLFLPAADSDEYVHLARRMGYGAEAGLSPAQRLHLDFEEHSASVRAFVEQRFGREGLPAAQSATIADLVLSDRVPEPVRLAALSQRGFRDPARAFVNLRRIAGEAERRSLFARLATLACDVLASRPDPDMALNNWERFLHAVHDPRGHLAEMLSQPARLEILLKLFSASQFLADILVKSPMLFETLVQPGFLQAARAVPELAGELAAVSKVTADRDDWRALLARFRGREILRIGARDLCLGVATQRITGELSDLAEAVVQAALARLCGAGESAPGFCIVAFGKLGARELNYSSDIDLLGLYGSPAGAIGVEEPGGEEQAAALLEALRADLSAHTPEGHAYRVDLRLRPYGSSGQLAFSLTALLAYYRERASPWEVQALLKARAVAGDKALGAAFLQGARSLLLQPRSRAEVVASIDRLRRQAVRGLSRSLPGGTDVKTGLGGLRDIEFLAQGLELVHAPARPELLEAGTLAALAALAAAGVLDRAQAEQLSAHYIFLRRVEHFLQIYEDRQTHRLPRDPAQLSALARLMLGGSATTGQFLEELSRRCEEVQASWRQFADPPLQAG